jgi:hypothetical protein
LDGTAACRAPRPKKTSEGRLFHLDVEANDEADDDDDYYYYYDYDNDGYF